MWSYLGGDCRIKTEEDDWDNVIGDVWVQMEFAESVIFEKMNDCAVVTMEDGVQYSVRLEHMTKVFQRWVDKK